MEIPTEELTPKQKAIYDYIVSFRKLHGFSPSMRDIAAACGIASASNVLYHIKQMTAAGYLTSTPGKHCSIVPVFGGNE